jgi:hypothetical protein
MKLAFWALLVLSLVTAPVLGQSSVPDPGDAIFQLATYTRDPNKDGNYRGRLSGTAFFVASDGTALTASHVVYSFVHDPKTYRLLAIIDKEFYDASVICATKLPYDANQPDTNREGVPFTRDLAKIKVAPTTAFEGRKDTLFLLPKNGDKLEWAHAHTGELPVFPFLSVGGHPGGHVRVIGYGQISALPLKWTAEGQVDRTFTGRDGTPMFDISSQNPAQPGNSGSPVLNDQNEVVGLWAWHYYNKPTVGTAQSNAVLTNPCP